MGEHGSSMEYKELWVVNMSTVVLLHQLEEKVELPDSPCSLTSLAGLLITSLDFEITRLPCYHRIARITYLQGHNLDIIPVIRHLESPHLPYVYSNTSII